MIFLIGPEYKDILNNILVFSGRRCGEASNLEAFIETKLIIEEQDCFCLGNNCICCIESPGTII